MNFEQMKEYLVAAAKAAGLTEYEIYATSSREMSTETLKGEISSFSSGESGGISFRCIVNGKMGYASSELLTREEMEALVDRAIDNAKNIEGASRFGISAYHFDGDSKKLYDYIKAL